MNPLLPALLGLSMLPPDPQALRPYGTRSKSGGRGFGTKATLKRADVKAASRAKRKAAKRSQRRNR